MVRCAICGVEVESIELAIQRNWVPGFFEYDEEHGPACPSCSESLLRMADDGEYEVLEHFRGKIIYLEEVEEDVEENEAVSMEDVFLGFILN
ncbi:MAG: hypothetical protein PVG49_05840 [Desulfobacteraceae bacterium]|jgi:hypothetical protein